MNSWTEMELGKAIQFNPPERIAKGKKAKKIPMDRLIAYQKKISGFELAEYVAGPKFRNGDTLVAKITPCLENGKTAQVDILEPNEVAFGSSEFIVLRENEHSINDFIFYLAKSPAFRKRAIGCMEGTSGRKRVNEGALKLQALPIPNKTTQQRIASVLSSLDAKIELNNKLNDNLEQMAKTLYDYWFVQFDFPDKDGKPYKSSGGIMVYNENLKGKIPDGWSTQSLFDVASVQYGFPFSTEFFNEEEKGVPVIRIRDILNNSISNYSTEREIDEKYRLMTGDILIGMDGNFHINYWSKDNCYLNQRVVRIRNKNLANIYIRYQIEPYIQLREKSVSRTTVGHLSDKDLKAISVTVPDEQTIKLINPLLENLTNQMISNQRQNQFLSGLRDWLLPMLMNGQVRID